MSGALRLPLPNGGDALPSTLLPPLLLPLPGDSAAPLLRTGVVCGGVPRVPLARDGGEGSEKEARMPMGGERLPGVMLWRVPRVGKWRHSRIVGGRGVFGTQRGQLRG